MSLYFAHTCTHTLIAAIRQAQTHTWRRAKTHLARMHIKIRGLWCPLRCAGETQRQFLWWHCRETFTFITALVLLWTLIHSHHQAHSMWSETLMAVFAPASAEQDVYAVKSSVQCNVWSDVSSRFWRAEWTDLMWRQSQPQISTQFSCCATVEQVLATVNTTRNLYFYYHYLFLYAYPYHVITCSYTIIMRDKKNK